MSKKSRNLSYLNNNDFLMMQKTVCSFPNNFRYNIDYLGINYLVSKYLVTHSYALPRRRCSRLAIHSLCLTTKFQFFQYLFYAYLIFYRSPSLVRILKKTKKRGHVFWFESHYARRDSFDFYVVYARILFYFYALLEIYPWRSRHSANDYFAFTIPQLQNPYQRYLVSYYHFWQVKRRIMISWKLTPAKKLSYYEYRAFARLNNVPFTW